MLQDAFQTSSHFQKGGANLTLKIVIDRYTGDTELFRWRLIHPRVEQAQCANALETPPPHFCF